MDKKYVSLNSLTNYDEKIKEYISDSLNSFLETIYPIGAIYLSISPTSPSVLFGGTWEQIKDTFLLSAGDDYTAGDTGGESEHTLTVDEMPEHNHYVKTDINNADYNLTWEAWTEWTTGYKQVAYETTSAPNGTTSTGGDAAHNNMPPYLAVYMWKRTG